MSKLLVLAGIVLILVGLPWAIVEAVDFFSLNCDSIYDPRSKYRKWIDARKNRG